MENTCGFREFDVRPSPINTIDSNTLFISTQTASVNTFWKPSIDIVGTWDYQIMGATYDGKNSYLKDEIPDSVVWSSTDFGIGNICATDITVPPSFAPENEQVTEARNFNTQDLSVTAYPNPATRLVRLDISGEFNEGNVKIFDLTGRMIHSELIKSPSISHSIDLFSKNFESGMYVFEISLDNRVFLERVMIMK